MRQDELYNYDLILNKGVRYVHHMVHRNNDVFKAIESFASNWTDEFPDLVKDIEEAYFEVYGYVDENYNPEDTDEEKWGLFYSPIGGRIRCLEQFWGIISSASRQFSHGDVIVPEWRDDT